MPFGRENRITSQSLTKGKKTSNEARRAGFLVKGAWKTLEAGSETRRNLQRCFGAEEQNAGKGRVGGCLEKPR